MPKKDKGVPFEIRDIDDLLDELGLPRFKPAPKKDVSQEISSGDSRESKALATLQEYETIIRQIASQPFGYATVIDTRKENGTAVIIHEGRTLEVLAGQKPIQPGDTVKILLKNFQIIDIVQPPQMGSIGTVRRVIEPTRSEVECQGATKITLNGKCAGQLEVGDRVRLDQSCAIILERLNKEEERYRFSEETNVRFDDIGGLVEAKELLIEAIELPHKHPELFSFYNKKPPKGILLYGPPGCGKTMLAKASATSLKRVYQDSGKSQSSGFFYIRGPEILDRYVGAAEATIRQIFDLARDHQKKSGYPAIIFIDEADAILNKRGSGISSDVERTIVPMFLAEMDGIQKSGAIVLLATNRQDTLDPAIIRDGRIDRKIKVTRPTKKVSAEIFELYLKDVPLADKKDDLKSIAEFATAEFFSESRILYDIVLDPMDPQRKASFTLADLVSGAMIKGIVDRATSIALHRDLEIDAKSGVARGDIIEAIKCAFRENFDMNHEDELEEFIREHGGGIPIKRLIQDKK